MGKVHGSLARTGKVNTQTSKVAKAEKKKKKRFFYNRPFRNIVRGGPNRVPNLNQK